MCAAVRFKGVQYAYDKVSSRKSAQPAVGLVTTPADIEEMFAIHPDDARAIEAFTTALTKAHQAAPVRGGGQGGGQGGSGPGGGQQGGGRGGGQGDRRGGGFYGGLGGRNHYEPHLPNKRPADAPAE